MNRFARLVKAGHTSLQHAGLRHARGCRSRHGALATLSKSIAFHDESLRQDPVDNWRPALNPYGQRLSTQTVGIVGLGRIRTAAALRLKAFDMDVQFFDPFKPNGYELALGIKRVDSLETLMATSDIVTLHCRCLGDTSLD